jgi:CBS domain containing-hemolysin-like protein
MALAGAGLVLAALTVLLLVFFGILADVIGLSVASASEAPIAAMAAKKVRGAKRALWLLKNADRVSSVCSDMAGDICSVVSGSAGAALVLRLTQMLRAESDFVLGILVSALVAALTVGGKAVCKGLAIGRAKEVVLLVGLALSLFSKE